MSYVNHDSMALVLTCPRGLEEALAREAGEITGKDALADVARVHLRGSYEDMVRLNLAGRIASRVLTLLAKRHASDERSIYRAARSIPWEELFLPDRSFKIKIESKGSSVRSLNYIALHVKDAVCDRFRDKAGYRPDVDKQDPEVRIQVFLDESNAYFYLDSSGESLFKRGYRLEKDVAPLRENLAAGMLALCGYKGERPFFDPMCGSGTIAIEAAMIAKDLAPGLQRRFAFENWADFDKDVLMRVGKELTARIRQAPVPVFAADVDPRAVDMARRNAQRAGVVDAISWSVGDFRDSPRPCEQGGLLMANPPYGERLGDLEAIRREAAAWGAALKRRYDGWDAALITPDRGLPAMMGLRPARRFPLRNGDFECRLFAFNMYKGSNRKRRDPEAVGGADAGDLGAPADKADKAADKALAAARAAEAGSDGGLEPRRPNSGQCSGQPGGAPKA